MHIVVIDTNVLLQAWRNIAGPGGECWSRGVQGKFTMVSSRATRRELGELLLRPIIAAKLAITALEVDDFMAEIDEFTLLIDPVPRHFSFERDPKDLPFLNLAIEARATHLITRDRDLLDLRDPANPDHAEWAKLAPDLAIVSPEEFLSAMI